MIRVNKAELASQSIGQMYLYATVHTFMVFREGTPIASSELSQKNLVHLREILHVEISSR
jgi:hypothetical protein